MKILTVIPLKKGYWKEDLTYFSAKDVENGSIVSIALRNKKILGLVISKEDASNAKINIKEMSFNLKKIIGIKEHSIFRKEYLDSAIEISKYNIRGKNNAVASLIPALFRENYDTILKFSKNLTESKNTKLDSFSLKNEKLLFQAPILDRLSYYKTLIRGSFAEKKSVFIVLPTEYDIEVFEESLSRGIEQFVFTFYAKLNTKKIINKLEQVMSLAHPILILGTAPFLSIKRDDIKTIIVEHERSNAYKMIGINNFDLRLFAELYSAKINARFILADTLLRYESIARVDLDGLVPLHPLSFRINFLGQITISLPEARLRAARSLASGTPFKILTDESIEQIKKTISKKKNVFIFSLRKGLATITLCRDCGEEISCEKCETPLVLYSSQKGKKRIFVCNRCQKEIKKEIDGDIACRACGSWNLVPLGIGTDTVYEEIKRLFPLVKVFKLDKESAKNEKGAEKIIKEYEENQGSILIATEMAFSYLQNKVPLSIIASFDSLWSLPNFKMGERIIQIILSVINITTEKLIIQTKNENDPAILAIKTENLLPFVREELEDRKKLNYPPYKRFIKITHLGDKIETIKIRKYLEETFQKYNPEIFSGFVSKQKDQYITNALIKLEPKNWSLIEISTKSTIDENLRVKLLSLPPPFQVSVDPEDLL